MLFSRYKTSLSLGARGEKVAQKYLKKCGYKILATNFYNPIGRRLGEIDIIAQDKAEIVFVEVKTRQSYSQNAPLPEESINPAKLHKLNKIASFYIAKNHLLGTDYRFDAITLLVNEDLKSATLKHLKNIFI